MQITHTDNFDFLEEFYPCAIECAWEGPEYSGLDIETQVFDYPDGRKSGLNPIDTEIATVQISIDNRVWVVQIPEGKSLKQLGGVEWLRIYLYESPVIKCIHNAVFEQSFLSHHLSPSKRIWPLHDTQIGEYNLAQGRHIVMTSPGRWEYQIPESERPRQDIGLGDTVFRRYAVTLDKDDAVRLSFRKGGSLTDRQLSYAAFDAHWAERLAQDQVKEFDENTGKIFRFDCENVFAVARMSLNGMPVDRQALEELDRGWRAEARAIEEGLKVALWAPPDGQPVFTKSGKHKTTGGVPQYHQLKITSDSQMPPRLRMFEINVPDFREDSIKNFAGNPIADAVLRHKKLQTFRTRYTVKFPKFIHPLTGRAYCDYRITVTTSGRGAAADPPLHQIPKRHVDGRKIRGCFRAPKGKLIVRGDFSMIELRLMAELWDERNMKRAFRDGMDLHTLTGAAISHKINRPDWALLMPAYRDLERLIQTGDQTAKDFRQQAKCFHPDTEVLTKGGWKKILQLRVGEEIVQATPSENFGLALSWVAPTNIFAKRAETLVHLKNEGIDIRVTPDHRMLVFRAKGHYDVVTPDRMLSARYWCNAGVLGGDQDADERLLRLAVATQADGSITPSGRIRFGFVKPRKIGRLRSLLRAGEYKESIVGTRYRVTAFSLSKELSSKILALLDGKKLPWWWLSLSLPCREVIVEEARYWDGSVPPKCVAYHFYSAQEQNIDVLQALATSIGYKSRKTRKAYLWALAIKDHKLSRGDTLDYEEQKYGGLVVCLSVPSTFVLVRDGGVPLVVGQCPNFGLGYGAGIPRFIGMAWEEYDQKWNYDFGKAMHDLWHGLYPGIRRRHRYIGAKLRVDGKICITTLEGRRRWTKSYSEALNHDIQGTGGDMLKRAQNAVCRDLENVLCVHDELVCLADESEANYAGDFLRAAMLEAGRYYLKQVPVDAEITIGERWTA